MTVDVVIPVIQRDLALFEVFFASWKKYWHVPGRLICVTPSDEKDTFSRFVSDEICLVDEEVVIGETKTVVPGWYKQQLVKIGAARIVNSEFYVAVDADCFFARQVYSAADLTLGDKLPWSVLHLSHNRRVNYESVANLFEIEFSALPSVAVSMLPPFFFRTATARNAVASLEAIKKAPWQDMLIRTPAWNEVTFYHVAATMLGEWNSFHTENLLFGPANRMRGHLGHLPIRFPWVDVEQDFSEWDTQETFSGKYLLGIIPSNAGIDAGRVAERLKRYL